MMARAATGIDVGLRTSIAVRGAYKGNTFHLSDFVVGRNSSRRPAASERGDTREQTEGWANLHLGFKPSRAIIGLTGRDVNIRYTRVPRVPDWQLRNLMRFEVEEIGGQSGSEVASDFNLLPEVPEVEGEDVVLLAMARESLLEQHEQGLASLGGKLGAFTPSSVGLYNAFLRYGVVEDDTVLVANIGHENIDVCICRGPDLLFARNLSGGSRLFDDAIAQRFDVGPEQAEKLKCDVATLRPGASYETPNHEKASRAILGAAGQLLSLLQSTVMFCKSQIKISGLKVDRVLLCGGGAALDGLPEYLHSAMGVPVELFDPFRVVDVGALDEEAAHLLEDYKLEAVVALGLATMGSDPEAYAVEILPGATARARAFWGGTAWAIAAAVLAVIYLGFYTVQQKRRLEEVRGISGQVQAQLRKANNVHKATEALIAQNEELSALGLELQGLAGSGEQVARVLRTLERHLPREFWIQRMESRWSYDEELGVTRALERPILTLKGRAREGTDSAAVLYQGFVTGLVSDLPQARLNHAIMATGSDFTMDLTLYAPSEPETPDREEARR